MRIAQVAPLFVAVPPKQYGGTERCIANLTEALVGMGHEVTLYASGDSETSARLIAPVPTALGFDPAIDVRAYHTAMLAEIYAQADRFDLIHTHLDFYPLPFAAQSTTPSVTTLHGRLDRPEFGRVYRTYRDLHYVAISRSQAAQIPDLNWAGVVHHGLDLHTFPFYPEPGNYLAFVGRISPEKRPDRAIEIAIKAGVPLKIAAKIDPSDRDYYESTIKPLMQHPLIEFIGEVSESEKQELMGHALALLVPIDWPEPFGMVFIEALACGVPVLTCPMGSVPELLVDGITGYVRRTVDELVEVVPLVRDHIDRAACRQHAEHHFSHERMAQDYTAVYQRLVRPRTPKVSIFDLSSNDLIKDQTVKAPLPELPLDKPMISRRQQATKVMNSLARDATVPLDFALNGEESTLPS